MVRTVSLTDYTAMKNPAHHWLIPGYVPKPGMILLIGEAKAGKTTLALQLALALGQGGKFLDKQATKNRVLFFQCDMSEFILRSVLQGYKAHGVPLDGDIFMPHPSDMHYGMNILLPEYQTYLTELRESCNPDVVFLDVLAELHSSDEQNSIAMKEVVNTLLKIFQGTTLIIVHHNRKPPQGYGPNGTRPAIDPISSSRGTSYLPGRADSVWMVDQNKLQIKGRVSPPCTVYLQRLPSGLWAIA